MKWSLENGLGVFPKGGWVNPKGKGLEKLRRQTILLNLEQRKYARMT